jgi:hypothetical protein
VRQLSHDLRSDPLEGMFKGGCLRTSLACLRSLEWVITSATLLSFCCDLGERFFSFLFFLLRPWRAVFFLFLFPFFFWEDCLGPAERGDRYLLDTGGGQECYKCGKVDHTARNCPASVADMVPRRARPLPPRYPLRGTDTCSISAVASAARPVATRADSKVAAAAADPDQGHGHGQSGGYTGGSGGYQQQSGARAKL